MSRRPLKPGKVSIPLATRLEAEEAAAVHQASGGDVSEWLRSAIREKLGRAGVVGAAESTSAFVREHDAGWRAGWAAANKQFRRALELVLAERIPEEG